VPPDGATGVTDAQDALAKMASEGFAPQTIVYLDVEPMDRIPPAQIDYVNGWLSQFSAAPFQPGIYCHVRNATSLKGAITGFPGRTDRLLGVGRQPFRRRDQPARRFRHRLRAHLARRVQPDEELWRRFDRDRRKRSGYSNAFGLAGYVARMIQN